MCLHRLRCWRRRRWGRFRDFRSRTVYFIFLPDAYLHFLGMITHECCYKGHKLVVFQNWICNTSGRWVYDGVYRDVFPLSSTLTLVNHVSHNWPYGQQHCWTNRILCFPSMAPHSTASSTIFQTISAIWEWYFVLDFIKACSIVFFPFNNRTQRSLSLLAKLDSSILWTSVATIVRSSTLSLLAVLSSFNQFFVWFL